MKWTKEQQNVIDFRNRDILVSAAAGSGKNSGACGTYYPKDSRPTESG